MHFVCFFFLGGAKVTFQYENDLLDELAYKSVEIDDCLPERNFYAEPTAVNGVQDKLLKMVIFESEHKSHIFFTVILNNFFVAALGNRIHKKAKNSRNLL